MYNVRCTRKITANPRKRRLFSNFKSLWWFYRLGVGDGVLDVPRPSDNQPHIGNLHKSAVGDGLAHPVLGRHMQHCGIGKPIPLPSLAKRVAPQGRVICLRGNYCMQLLNNT